MRFRRALGTLVGLSFVVGVTAMVACGSDSSEFGAGGGDGDGSTPENPNGDLFSSDGGTEIQDSGGKLVPTDGACASSKAEAVLSKRPVDIIVIIDNSGSMDGEIHEVENQINQNFATIIGGSGLDYRVIMLSRYGSWKQSQSICVSSPLSGANCLAIFPDGGASTDAGKPQETPRFFHYNREIASEDGWCRLLDAFAKGDNQDGYTLHAAGFGPLLRAEAFKTIVLITDDGMNCSVTANKPDGGTITGTWNDNAQVDAGFTVAASFDLALRNMSPTQFGDPDGGRNYVYHSIVALADFAGDAGADAGDPKMHPPTAPVITAMCSPGAQEPATGSQALSVLTGGLRYPTCTLSYTAIFQEMAKGVVQSSGVSCDFLVPQPPPGDTLDLNSLAVQYKPGGTGAVQEFSRAADLASCAANQFWLEGGANGTVHLCPSTCNTVKADLAASVSVVSGCARLDQGSSGGVPK